LCGTAMRSIVGALDHNLSKSREQAKTRAGHLRYKTNVSIYCLHTWFIPCLQRGRSNPKWTARPIYRQKDYSWKDEIIQRALECAAEGRVPDVSLPWTTAEEAAQRPRSELTKVATTSSSINASCLTPHSPGRAGGEAPEPDGHEECHP
jgi:hypothetical protein